MKFTAAGDAIIQRRIPEGFEGYDELSDFIKEGDARFYNLETTLNYEGECPASQYSGGTYLRTVPEVLLDIDGFGFNMTSFNNNHAMDFSYEGLYSTLAALDEFGIVHAGVGRNLGEASAPKYLETKNGRVALIAINTTFNPAMIAGDSNERVGGRAGINGIRIEKYMNVTASELKFIKDLAARTKINAEYDIIAREGYYPMIPEEEGKLGDLKFRLADESKYVMEANAVDVERLKRSIFEAQLQADYIIVSVHSHQISGDQKENPSDFLVELAHACIDAGANAVVGHGPHLLRPIEVYKDSPIFYSLGDFILELYSVEFAPADFFAKHGVSTSATVHELLKKRSKNFTVGLMTDPKMFLSVIPLWETEGTKLKSIKLMPVELAMNSNKSAIGLPRRADPDKVIKYLGDMSAPYGVKLTATEDGLIECSW